ncbi:MAG: DoxX family protein [Nitrospira sp.]
MLVRTTDLYHTFQNVLRPWTPLLLRLIVGYGFMAHGYAKFTRGPEQFIGILTSIGIPMPQLMGWATIIVQLLGGLCMVLGTCVLFWSIPMAAILIVAAVTVHWPYGFSSIKLQSVIDGRAQFGQPGYETDLLYLVCLAVLVVGGAGPYAVDNMLARKMDRAVCVDQVDKVS